MMTVDLCTNFGSLPRSGGLLDQDAYFVTGSLLVLGSRAEKDRREADRMEKESRRAVRR